MTSMATSISPTPPTGWGGLIDEIIVDAPAGAGRGGDDHAIADNNTNQRVQTYNAAITGLVNTRAARRQARDSGRQLRGHRARRQLPDRALMVDNLHPNDAGYVVLGRSFYGAISTLLQPGP
jgi:hypothetical protein